jgi:hypothetical protein
MGISDGPCPRRPRSLSRMQSCWTRHRALRSCVALHEVNRARSRKCFRAQPPNAPVFCCIQRSAIN